jgi:hypothetical protein
VPSLQLQHESSSVLLAGMENDCGGRSLSLSFGIESRTDASRIPRLAEFTRIKTNSWTRLTRSELAVHRLSLLRTTIGVACFHSVMADSFWSVEKTCILIVLVNITYAGRRFDVRD